MSVTFPATWHRVAQGMDPARLRFWGVVLPIHAVAFATLYYGNNSLLEAAYSQAGAAAARRQIEQVVREMPTMMPRVRGQENPHLFGHLLAMHQPIGLKLYGADSSLIWPKGVPPEASGEGGRVRRLLSDPGKEDQIWIEESEGRRWVRGVVRVNTSGDCQPCHEAGRTLGAASVKIDFTSELEGLQRTLRQRAVWLLATWFLLVGGVAFVVQHTVRRSLTELETDLAAAAAGRKPSNSSAGLPLDPASAAFHRRLSEFLRRQRAREVEVAERLERVDQLASLGQLSAGLAHEIKNPLAGIQGALEVLRHETSDGSTAHLYEEMLGELKRVNGILQRLLESGRPAPLRLARTNLGRLVADMVELMGPALRRKRVEVEARVEKDLPEARVDSAKIRQLLVNLIQNAAEAIGDKGGRVTVHASAPPGEDGVVLAVEDDGPGISGEDLDRLFEPFFTTKFAGTGLGLAISKSLVEQHGGRIEVTSEPGRGTTFFVFLPLGVTPASGIPTGPGA